MTAPSIEALIEAVLAKKSGNRELVMRRWDDEDVTEDRVWQVEFGNTSENFALGDYPGEFTAAGPTLWAALTDLLERLP